MRVYLSGPMSGIPSDNAPEFEAATRMLRAQGHEVISPIELDSQQWVKPDALWGDLLGRDVKIIACSNIEAICVLPGWSFSKGARLEVMLGLLLKLPIILVSGLVLERDSVIKTLADSLKEVR